MENNGFELIGEFLPHRRNWRFMGIWDRFLNNDEQRQSLLFHLEVGSRQMFKVFLLKKAMPYLILMPLPLVFTLLTLFLINRISPLVFWGVLLFSMLVLIYTQNQKILGLMDNMAVLRRIKNRILKILISLRMPEPLSYIIALVSWIHLSVFDRLFLKYGGTRESSGDR